MDKLSTSNKINSALKEMGVYDFKGLLAHLPRKYEFLSYTKKDELIDKSRVVIYGKVVTPVTKRKLFKVTNYEFSIYSPLFRYAFQVSAYNRSYLEKALNIGDDITLWGTLEARFNRINMINYCKGELDEEHSIKPIYSLPSSIENRVFSQLVRKALNEHKKDIYSYVPFFYQNKYHLVSKYDAFNYAHFPINKEQIKQALRHLKYEEALLFSLQNKLIHEENKTLAKIKKEPIDYDICKPFTSHLPFKLNEEQIVACKEIIDDMNQSSLMYRLLQGDVGTGKTVVSFVALYANYLRGDQGAIMAPTDALARQHYKNALEMFKDTKVKIALLVGSTSTKEKERLYQDIEDGSIDIVIGTHALFIKKIKYSSLGLVIIDEQHCFGVNQRQALLDKGKNADLLMMSATPIPRSLALTLYGDLDITTLTTFPNKKRDITTKILSLDEERIYKAVDYTLAKNERVYIVAPLIVENESRYSVELLFDKFNKKYGGKVSLLHGGLPQEKKEKALEDIVNGTTPILVSTQVIEVGIDVKSATLMVIYDASNFGLASLHQLRGRIGRDGSKSYCLLISEEGKEKLKILEESFDGFKIAEEDMKNRGPGDLTGLRQSGVPNFAYLNIIDDIKIFVTARDDANYIYAHKEEKQFAYVVKYCQNVISKIETIKA